MKISNFIISAALISAFVACEDDKTPILQLNQAAVLEQLSSTDIVLTKNNINNDFPTISWQKADYNGAATTYTVTLKNEETGKTVEIGQTNTTSLELKNSDINDLVAQTGAKPGVSTQYTISLIPTAADINTDEAQNTITFKLSPFDAQTEGIDWPFAYVAVNYPEGFNFKQAYLIGDPDGDGVYQGFVNLPKDATTFAIIDGSDFTNVLSKGNVLDESNLGFAQITLADDGSVTISDTTVWGLIGSATSNGWSKDTPMEYDQETRLWTTTTSLIEGEFKFRANQDWAINFGKGDDEYLAMDGSNLTVENPHAYIVSLNLTNAGKYTYTLEETDIVLSSAYLTVPGSFNDWNNKTEDYKIVSVARDFIFASTLFIEQDDVEFKFYDDGDGSWIGIVGDMAEDGSFTIGDGDNIKLEKAGYYNFNVNLKKMTASVVATGWELIGGAIEPYDWSVGIVMDYDAATKTWSKTLTVKDGDFKFRWAGGWDVNFGGTLTALEQDGENIAISAGTYKFVLDPEKKTASVTAQ